MNLSSVEGLSINDINKIYDEIAEDTLSWSRWNVYCNKTGQYVDFYYSYYVPMSNNCGNQEINSYYIKNGAVGAKACGRVGVTSGYAYLCLIESGE